ncbi:dihydroneopterin aldolase [Azospirillum doebereinerae]|uniref:dihydroneopterin aldolase n=1 Tax=Azospirillum doebereinerae TaxID=92933 RepID=A0A433J204_9PROT|nr:dihydroneopterin aldolase [Azospirillum doebereinerae]RUQ65143.1 dihydroneopterin aldolase [Azospirillum doebereinerae]
MDTPSSSPYGTYVIAVRGFVAPFEIGVYAHEHGRRQRLRIDLRLTVRRTAPRFTDDVATVLSYEGLVAALETLSEGPHIQLLESLADRIGDLCLSDPRVVEAEVSIEKPHVFPQIDAAGVTIAYRR